MEDTLDLTRMFIIAELDILNETLKKRPLLKIELGARSSLEFILDLINEKPITREVARDIIDQYKEKIDAELAEMLDADDLDDIEEI